MPPFRRCLVAEAHCDCSRAESEPDRSDPVRIERKLRKSRVTLILALIISISASVERSFANPGNEAAPAPPSANAAESYVLPITPPLDQGDTGLCWMYATLSMLETNYLTSHPGSQISLSRGAMQVEAVEDRLERWVRGESTRLPEGGLAVEALALIRKDGIVAKPDFSDIVDSNPVAESIEKDLARIPDRAAQEKALTEEVHEKLGVVPEVTHLDGQVVSAERMAHAVTDGSEWTEFDLSPDGSETWGPSLDPDARPETRVKYVKLEVLINLIHQSLARGQAVVWGSLDHALLIYGGDYDSDGKPLSYLIKDSFEPYTYRESAEEIHKILHDVTVAR
jgi:hypothetical protein